MESLLRLQDIRGSISQRRAAWRLRGPLAEVEVGRDHHAGVLVESARQMELQGYPAGLNGRHRKAVKVTFRALHRGPLTRTQLRLSCAEFRTTH